MIARTKFALTWTYLASISFLYGSVVEFGRHYRWHSGPALLTFAALGSFGIFAWYYLDAKARNFRRKPLLDLLVVCIAVLGVPAYLFLSRGFKKGASSFFIFLGLIVLSSILEWAGILTAYGILLAAR